MTRTHRAEDRLDATVTRRTPADRCGPQTTGPFAGSLVCKQKDTHTQIRRHEHTQTHMHTDTNTQTQTLRLTHTHTLSHTHTHTRIVFVVMSVVVAASGPVGWHRDDPVATCDPTFSVYAPCEAAAPPQLSRAPSSHIRTSGMMAAPCGDASVSSWGGAAPPVGAADPRRAKGDASMSSWGPHTLPEAGARLTTVQVQELLRGTVQSMKQL